MTSAASQPDKSLLLYLVGDIGPSRKDVDSIFAEVSPVFHEAEIVFAQLETNLTDRGVRLPQAAYADRISPDAAAAFRRSGFNVISCASNHCMDWGPDGLFDTLSALGNAGISVVGAGANIQEARRPVILNRDGTRIAFLAYNSILPAGYWADEKRPGCVPLRAHTVFEQIETDQPGTPALIETFAFRGDLEAMKADIAKARANADVVIVSMHFGIHFVPVKLADYQIELAHAAIDAGADMIIGHHPHILKGVEVYRGRPILYSLGNFAMDLPMTPELAASKSFKNLQKLYGGWEVHEDDMYNCPPETQNTLVAKCIIAQGKIRKFSLLPTWITRKNAAPTILKATDPLFTEVANYLETITAGAGLQGHTTQQGDELIPDGLDWSR
jgi:poly-gamma-glutamate synthesis protein (capsule biosynthesis protein)